MQAGRGIAALMVVLFHVSSSIFGRGKYFPERFWWGFSGGHAGVDFFFVLSGFIIVYVHADDVGNAARTMPFLRRRFLRIYPIYWVLLCAILPVFFVAPWLRSGHELNAALVLTSFTLLPAPYHPAIPVAWTLQHEVLFYILFSVLIYKKRAGIFLLVIWLIGSISYAFFMYMINNGREGPLNFFAAVFFPWDILFFYGGFVAWQFRRGAIFCPWILATIGTTLFLGAALYEGFYALPYDSLTMMQLYGVGSAVGVAGFVELERRGAISVARPLLFLGDASYSLYLVHALVLSVLAKIAVKIHLVSLMPAWAIFWGFLLMAVVAGLLFHLVVERNLERWIARRTQRAVA